MNASRVAGWETTARVVKPPAEPPRITVRAPSTRPCEASVVAAEAQSAISAMPHAPLSRSLCHVSRSVEEKGDSTRIHVVPSVATGAAVIDIDPAEKMRPKSTDENETRFTKPIHGW